MKPSPPFRSRSFLSLTGFAAVIGTAAIPAIPASGAGVVINEILYNAPNDLGQLEYIELFNDSAESTDISGWKLTKGVTFTFPQGSEIAPHGFLVVCRNRKLFGDFYEGVPAAGEFSKSLSNSSDTIHLRNAQGTVVESVEYADTAPWPVSADGYSASLERICPSAAADSSRNWAPSILSDDYNAKPSGTPGRQNSAYSQSLPPVISMAATGADKVVAPGEAIAVEAVVHGAEHVELLYRVIAPGQQGDEVALALEPSADGRCVGSIPGQEANRIVRYRVRATASDGAVRLFPHPNEIRPARSVYVSGPVETGEIPVAHFFNIGTEEFKRGKEYRTNSGSRGRGEFRGFGGPPQLREEDRVRMETGRALDPGILVAPWTALTIGQDIVAPRPEILQAFRGARDSLASLRDELEATGDDAILAFAGAVPGKLESMGDALRAGAGPVLETNQRQLLAGIGKAPGTQGPDRGPGGRGFNGGNGGFPLQRLFDVERIWFDAAMNPALDPSRLPAIQSVITAAIERRDATGREAQDGGRPDFRAIMEALDSQRRDMEAALSAAGGEAAAATLAALRPAQDPFGRDRRQTRGPGGFPGRFGGGNETATALLPQGNSAFIYRASGSDTTRFFDYVNIVQRKSGYKVRLHKDRPLDGMTTINVLYEPGESTILNEALAYDLYRAAGNASPRSGYVRVVMDGELVGHHLWFEQPNGAFFRHNRIDDDGNLYKVIWQGSNVPSKYTPGDKMPQRRNDIVGRHEKKTHPHDGYEDIIALVESLEAATDDDAMWAVIQQAFDVEQVLNYFAVNSLISHWDGFFNNYFLYHDTKRKKWMLFPWDQDSTWSQRGGDPEQLYEMPLNFGAEDAVPPGADGDGNARDRRRGGRFGGFGGGGFGWWRDGGEISGPLLANPQFRQRFLARVKELAETVFTEEIFGPKIVALGAALEPEAALRAEAHGRNPGDAGEELRAVIASLQEHLAARRKFVIEEVNRLAP